MKLFSERSINRIIFVLSLVGVVIAIYVLQSFLRESSIVCLNQGCEIVRKSPESYIFGIPVPTFGLVGYSLLAVIAFVRTMSKRKELLYGTVWIATFGVLFVAWFTYTEIYIIKAICTWCAVSAAIMTTIFLLSMTNLWQRRQYAAHH